MIFPNYTEETPDHLWLKLEEDVIFVIRRTDRGFTFEAKQTNHLEPRSVCCVRWEGLPDLDAHTAGDLEPLALGTLQTMNPQTPCQTT